jgi:hypothetical membrane protein
MWYSPVTNWLSDLGNTSFNPIGAVFYNIGCVLTGIALFPFFAGFYKWYTYEKWRKISLIATQLVGFFAAFSLVMIGVFSEDFMEQHVFWSSVFFVLNLVVLILAGLSLFTHPNYIKSIAYYGFVVAGINLVFVLVHNTPLFEWVTVFTALGYVGLLVYNMFMAQSQSIKNF